MDLELATLEDIYQELERRRVSAPQTANYAFLLFSEDTKRLRYTACVDKPRLTRMIELLQGHLQSSF